MADEKNIAGNNYRDVAFFIVAIPLINAVNYFLTYSNIQFSWFTLLTFSLDTVVGYIAWYNIRSIILRLDAANTRCSEGTFCACIPISLPTKYAYGI